MEQETKIGNETDKTCCFTGEARRGEKKDKEKIEFTYGDRVDKRLLLMSKKYQPPIA